MPLVMDWQPREVLPIGAIVSKVMRHNESLLEHVSPAIGTPCRHLKDVLCSRRIRPGDAIKKMIEKEFGIFGIAVFAKRNETLRLL
jgi:hypothetical protein